MAKHLNGRSLSLAPSIMPEVAEVGIGNPPLAIRNGMTQVRVLLSGTKYKRGNNMEKKKVSLKMGIHNRITKERFAAIKADLKGGLSAAKVQKRHHVGATTVRKIRRSKDYNDYRVRADEQVRSKEGIVVICPITKTPYEDYGPGRIFFSPKPVKKTSECSWQSELNKRSRGRGAQVAVVCLSIVAIVSILAVLIMGLGR